MADRATVITDGRPRRLRGTRIDGQTPAADNGGDDDDDNEDEEDEDEEEEEVG